MILYNVLYNNVWINYDIVSYTAPAFKTHGPDSTSMSFKLENMSRCHTKASV